MNYTKQQLELPRGESFLDGLTIDEISEETLSWKKWRIVEHKKVSAGCLDEFWYTVETLDVGTLNGTALQWLFHWLWLLEDRTPRYFLRWVADSTKLNTALEANLYIQKEIAKYKPYITTTKVVGIEPH